MRGDKVNVEVDILARYVAKMLGLKSGIDQVTAERPGALTAERLQALGY
jgi:hypothetical protein